MTKNGGAVRAAEITEPRGLVKPILDDSRAKNRVHPGSAMVCWGHATG
jgi:hypothetical protein